LNYTFINVKDAATMEGLDVLWVVAAGLMEPIWMVSLKKYNDSKNILWGGVVLLFMFIGPACLSMATEGGLQISIAYSIWVSIGTVMTTLVGWIFYKDPLDKETVLFVLMILAGVVGLNLFLEAR
jgi:multidrug transporter EmrE-like cation transporter